MNDQELLNNIRIFLLNNYSLVSTAGERETLLDRCNFPKVLQNQVDIKGSNLVFINDLVKKSNEFGRLDSGKLALVTLLEYMKENLGKDKEADINTLITDVNELEKFCVIVVIDDSIKLFNTVDFEEAKKEIVKTNRERRWEKTVYPDFNIDQWLSLNCQRLVRDSVTLSRRIKVTDRIIGMLIDLSFIENLAERSECLNTLNLILVNGPTNFGKMIAALNNQTKAIKIPRVWEQYFWATIKDTSDLAFFLWQRYHERMRIQKAMREMNVEVNLSL